MASSAHLAVLAALALVASFAEARGAGGGRISPDLDPESSKKFFNKEYPADTRPVADKQYFGFKHPYPIVQETAAFDKDFVSDENSDNGEWKAQMSYDVLRNKLRHQKETVENALKKEQSKKEELKVSKGLESEAEKDAKKATEASEAATADAEKADDEVKHLAGSGNGTGADGAIGDAVDKVEKEMSDLEKCKKELEEAKAELKKLMKEKQALDAKKAGGGNATNGTDAEEAEVDKKVAKAGKSVEKLEKEMKSLKRDHSKAEKSVVAEKKEEKQTEKDLEKAAEELRRFRHGGKDPKNKVPKSGANVARISAALLLTVLVAAVGVDAM